MASTTLGILDDIAEELDNYRLLHATRGTMLENLGRLEDAAQAYQRAAEPAPTAPEVRFLSRKHKQITAERRPKCVTANRRSSPTISLKQPGAMQTTVDAVRRGRSVGPCRGVDP